MINLLNVLSLEEFEKTEMKQYVAVWQFKGKIWSHTVRMNGNFCEVYNGLECSECDNDADTWQEYNINFTKQYGVQFYGCSNG